MPRRVDSIRTGCCDGQCTGACDGNPSTATSMPSNTVNPNPAKMTHHPHPHPYAGPPYTVWEFNSHADAVAAICLLATPAASETKQ